MYVFCCSYAHNVAANNKWLAFVSTTVRAGQCRGGQGDGARRGAPASARLARIGGMAQASSTQTTRAPRARLPPAVAVRRWRRPTPRPSWRRGWRCWVTSTRSLSPSATSTSRWRTGRGAGFGGWGARLRGRPRRDQALRPAPPPSPAPLDPPNPPTTSSPRRPRDKCYISTGYDPTTHFETTVEDVLSLYRRITGESPDLDSRNPRLAEAAAAE